MFLTLACHNFGSAVTVQRRFRRNCGSISLRKQYFPPYAFYRCLSIYGSTALVDIGPFFFIFFFFHFLIYRQSVGFFGRVISPTQGYYLHTEQDKHRKNAHRHPCLEWNSNPRFQCPRRRRCFIH
jgi:hypothetical protein